MEARKAELLAREINNMKTAHESTSLTIQEKDKTINALNSLIEDQEKKLQEKEALYQKLDDDFKKAKVTVTELWNTIKKMKNWKK